MVSVIIPTFNRAKMVADCVASVLATTGVDFEVIVVDDCSTEDIGNTLAQRFGANDHLRVFRNETNLQLGRSRARGETESRGDILLFLDDDNIVEPDMLAHLAQEFAAHPEAGLIAPMAIHANGTKAGKIWTLGSDFNRWTSCPHDYLPLLPLEKLPTDRTRFPTLYSPNAFAVRKETYKKVGGFDFNLPFCYDDADFGWRIHKLGLENRILTTARTHHMNFIADDENLQLRELGLGSPWRAYPIARNRLRFARKHFSFVQYLSVAFVFAPLSAVYYGVVALKNRRSDIAWAYLKGTLAGIFAR